MTSCISLPPLQLDIRPNPQTGEPLSVEAQIFNLLLGSPILEDGTVDISGLLLNPLTGQINEARTNVQILMNAVCMQSAMGGITGGISSTNCPWIIGNPMPNFSTGSTADQITSLMNDTMNTLQDLQCHTNSQLTQMPTILGAAQGAYDTMAALGGAPMDKCTLSDAVLALLTGGLGTELLAGVIQQLINATNIINGAIGDIIDVMQGITNTLASINNAIAQSINNLSTLFNAITKGSSASSMAALINNPCGWAITNILAAPRFRSVLPPQPVYKAS